MSHNKAAPPTTVPLLHVEMSLKGEPPAYQVGLTQSELAGIGYVTVQWSHLEAVISIMTQQFCEAANIDQPKDASNFSFARRLRAFRAVACELLVDNPARRLLLKQIPKIARLAGHRQRVTHHLWEYDPHKPQAVWSRTVRHPNSRMEKFDVTKLRKLGRQIGEVTFALENPHLDGATNSEVFAATLADHPAENGHLAFVSRSFLLALHEKAPKTQDRPQDKPPKRTPPQSSSEE